MSNHRLDPMEPSYTSSTLTEGPWSRGGVPSEESIKLIPKIRPSTTPDLPDYVKYVCHKALALSAPGAENAHWDFDFVASPHTRQSSFFRVAGRPMADHFLAFYNAAIIAYGQTGSGKTHTMLGNLPSDKAPRSLSSNCFDDMPREAGLIPRVLGYIFQQIAADSNGGSNHKQSIATAGARHLPQPPPASQQACTTPVAAHVRSRGRSGIPTPSGVPPRNSCLTPPPPSPQRTPENVHAPKPPAGRSPLNKPANTGATEYLVKASMLQIYQEVVTDLLNPRQVKLQIRESMDSGVMVVNLSEVVVHSAAEALQLLRHGTSNRAVAETASNPVSSRSHCILTLYMEAKDKMDTGVVRIRRSRLQLVDLAGSERTPRGADYGSARQKETNAINKSLSTLCLVIARLSDRNRNQGPVPYRDSKLTFLLQDCLGGNAKTLIIANLNPSPTCATETNITLGFALRAKRVRNRAVINEDHQGDAVILQGEVQRLRQELSIFRTLHAKDGPPQGIEELSAWRDQTAARVSQLHQALQVNGELEEKLVAKEAEYSRLRMEHAALEEQCEAQRCEMSALEATVEQCEDELHELRTRPTLAQLQALEEQLREALCERDDAHLKRTDAVQQNQQLLQKCEQLTGLLEAYQQQRREPTQAVVIQTDPEQQDHMALEEAYTALKGSYDALVQQNRNLQRQLEAATRTADVDNAVQENSGRNEWRCKQRHRYSPAESCLISGGLEAVTEAAEEYYMDEFLGASPEQARTAPTVASLSEQVRLASPTSLGGSSGQESASASSARPSPPPPSPSISCGSEAQGSDAFMEMRSRCHSKGAEVKALAFGANRAGSDELQHSVPVSSPDGNRSYESAPPSFSLTNFRSLASLQAGSPLQTEATGMIRQDSDDAAESRSLGALVRVNPLFDCRLNGEDRLRSAGREDETYAAEAVGAKKKATSSLEAPAASESIACELPMPPDKQITLASPRYKESPSPSWSKGRCSSGRIDSGVGIARSVGWDGSTDVSGMSETRRIMLLELQLQPPSVSVMAAVEVRRSKTADLLAEPSLAVTPCSHPQSADARAGNVKPQIHSPARVGAAGSSVCDSPPSPVSAFGGFASGAVGSFEATMSATKLDSKRARALYSTPPCNTNPLMPLSLNNKENMHGPCSKSPGGHRETDRNKDKVLVLPCTALSPCVTGVSGQPPFGSRPAWSASRNTAGRCHTTNQSPNEWSPRLLECGTLAHWPEDQSPGVNAASTPDNVVSCSGRDHSAAGSPVTPEGAGPSRLCEEVLVDNMAMLERELAVRLQAEAQLRDKLQQALREAQDAAVQAADLVALNNGMIEEIAERDERLRDCEDVVTRQISEIRAILRQGLREVGTPVQYTATVTNASSPVACKATVDAEATSVSTAHDSEPVTVSPAERPRVIESFETGVGSPLSFGAGSTPQYSLPRLPVCMSVIMSPSQSCGSQNTGVVIPSPMARLIGFVQEEGMAMKTELVVLLGKLRDGLLERDQRVAGLEEELGEARARLERVEQEMQELQGGMQFATPRPSAEQGCSPIDVAAQPGSSRPADTATVVAQDTSCVNTHGFIAPPSPACSDSDPHPLTTWGPNRDPESGTRREANLQAQLRSRDCQVFVLLERNEQLEASLRAALAERDQFFELQSHAARLASNLQTQMWKRDAKVDELQARVTELDASLQRSTTEAVRFRQQAAEAVEQCDRYALELRGLERREELLMNKLRTLELSCAHRAHEIEELRTELSSTSEQLSAMQAKAMAAEEDAAHARQVAASLEEQLDDLRRSMGMVQQPQLGHRQQQHYTFGTIRPIGSTAGTHPATWPPGGPYMYTARSDGSTVEGHAMTYPMPSLSHMEYGPMGQSLSGMSLGGRPLGRSSRNATYSQVAPSVASGKTGLGYGYSKGGGSRGHAPAPSAAGMEHGAANKGTWVQRFLCRKGVSVDGSPGQEAHVAILTPAKLRTKGMTGIVLRQWVGNGSSKTASRKG